MTASTPSLPSRPSSRATQPPGACTPALVPGGGTAPYATGFAPQSVRRTPQSTTHHISNSRLNMRFPGRHGVSDSLPTFSIFARPGIQLFLSVVVRAVWVRECPSCGQRMPASLGHRNAMRHSVEPAVDAGVRSSPPSGQSRARTSSARSPHSARRGPLLPRHRPSRRAPQPVAGDPSDTPPRP